MIILSNLQQIHLKLLQKESFKKKAEATEDLIGDKTAERIKKLSKSLRQKNSETITNENNKEIPKEKDISPEERQEIIYELRII